MSGLIYALLFAIGAAVGSFLNVVVLRYKSDRFLFDLKLLGGRSHCPSCGHKLEWYELIPIVSFVALGGKCLKCKKPISWQYPISEALSGVIFVLVPAYFMNAYNVVHIISSGDTSWFYALNIIWIFAFLALLVISAIDFREYLIPNELTLFIALLGVGTTIFSRDSFIGFYSQIFEISTNPWVSHLFGALVAFLFFGFIIGISRGKAMGIGDLKLATALGFLFGWPDIVLVAMISFVIGSLVGIRLLLGKKKTLRDVVPFGPFLALASVIVFFFGFQVIGGYFTLFGL